MEPQKELLGVGKTFLLTSLVVVGGIVLMATGKLPAPETFTDYFQNAAMIIAPYALKSGLSKVGNGK